MDKKKSNVHVDLGRDAFFTDSITVSHGKTKFVVDFTQTTPRFDTIEGQTHRALSIKHNTIMMDIELAKIFYETLGDNVKHYEKKFGKIKIPKKQKPAKGKVSATKHEESKYIG